MIHMFSDGDFWLFLDGDVCNIILEALDLSYQMFQETQSNHSYQ